ncbi:MAG: P27 family phage terminase small subunit [Bacillota bacterium]
MKASELRVISENRYAEIYQTTVESLKSLGTYKGEFSPLICRYAEMRLQHEILMQQWYESSCKITERYTNKAGATNRRKTALYQSIENLRRELLEVENTLGMTPAGIKRINHAALKGKTASKLEEMLGKAVNGGDDMS